ncbi:hypothetical protein [Oscillatoria acuminata]|nr:hypothetical protein [Oscillatoria acuminata]
MTRLLNYPNRCLGLSDILAELAQEIEDWLDLESEDLLKESDWHQ